MENNAFLTRLHPSEPVLEALAAAEAACFALPWSKKLFEVALSSDLYDLFGVYSGETLAGFAVFCTVADEAEVQDLAVLPAFRRQGFGRMLLEAGLSSARSRGAAAVYLEVREGNAAARTLYEALGFFVCGRRKNYYDLPREDAILYQKPL